MLAADDAAERGRRVWEWAHDVWAAWQAHHPTVRAWLDAVESEAGRGR